MADHSAEVSVANAHCVVILPHLFDRPGNKIIDCLDFKGVRAGQKHRVESDR